MPQPRMFEAHTPLRGIVSMLLAGVFLVTNDAITKHLVPHYPVGQILYLQAIVIALITSLWIRARRERIFRFTNPKGHLARGLLYVVGSFSFVYALKFLPLGEVIAIAFAGPLFLTLFGKLFLGEQVGPHRLAAVVAGFIGVLIMMRPGAAMHWAVFLPLVVAIADAFRDIVTRTTTVGESSQRIVLSTALIVAIAGLLTALAGDWETVQTSHIAWFIGSASAFVVAHYFLVEAYRHAQTVIVGPIRYLQLVWGILIGWYFFEEQLDGALILGACIILAAGLYIAWREGIRKKGVETTST